VNDITRFLEDLQDQTDSAETRKAYESDLRIFANYLETKGLSIAELRPSQARDYVAFLRSRPGRKGPSGRQATSSVNRRVSAVSALYRFLFVDTDGAIGNPFSPVRRSRKKKSTPRPIQPDKIDAILAKASASPRDSALLELFLSSGARLSELQQLDRTCFTIHSTTTEDGRKLRFGEFRVLGKGSKERTLFTTESVLQKIKIYLKGRKDYDPALFVSNRNTRISKRMIEVILQKYCMRALVTPENVHALRHTFATDCANSGMSAYTLKDLLGHEDLETTLLYLKAADQKVRQEYFAAMEAIDKIRATV